ncbi:MAG: M48 family metalloprotease [Alphaproteobacteria bacterium]
MPEISDTEKEQLVLAAFVKKFPKALIRELREDDFPSLQQEIKEMAARVGKSIFKIYVVESKKVAAFYHHSTNSMAFTVGMLQHPEIGLVELQSVVGHEIAHDLVDYFEYTSTAKALTDALPPTLQFLTVCMGVVAAIHLCFGRVEKARDSGGVFLLGALTTMIAQKTAPKLQKFCVKAINRQQELECDAVSVALNMPENPHGLIKVLEIAEITDQHKPSSHHDWRREMKASHPTLWNRALHIENLASNPDAVEKLQRKYSIKPAHKP